MTAKNTRLKQPGVFQNCLFRFLFTRQKLVAQRRKHTADQRTDDEDPQAGKRIAADEDRRAEGARRVHGRAGEVDAEDVDKGERQTDHDAAVFNLARYAENRNDEDEGQHDFDQERSDDFAVIQSVGAKTAVRTEQTSEGERAEGCAGKLGNDIAEEISHAHFAADQHGDGDRRVDMAAGDVADGIRHGNDDQTEGGGRQEIGGVGFRGAAERGSGAAGDEDQHKRADAFRNILFQSLHKSSSL